MKNLHYTILAGLCISGAILLAVLDKPEAQVAILLGLGGTLAGRGPKTPGV